MTSHAQARQEILAAWPHVFADDPTLAELQAVQAVGLEETHYGDYFNGNWGAIQGARAGADGSCPPGTFAHGDTHEDGAPYAACFKLYASRASAAQDLIRTVFIGSPGTRWDRAPVRAAARSGDQIAFDTALRKSGYYELPLTQHIAATTRSVKDIAASLGESIALSPNGPTTGQGSPWLEVGVASLATVASVMAYRKWGGRVARNPVRKKPTAEQRASKTVHELHFAGYDFTSGPGGTIIDRTYTDTSDTRDYGADPLGDGMFKMVPSGDIVDYKERSRRLERFDRR